MPVARTIPESMPTGKYKRTKPAWNKGLKGKKLSEETKKKMSIAQTGNKHSKGRIPWNKGKSGYKIHPWSKESRDKLIGKRHSEESIAKMSGASCHLWKCGISSNKQYLSWIKNKRNRDKRKNDGSHTFGEWETLKAQYNWTCPCCGKTEPEIQLTEDHIIPVSKGGSDNIENIQPLCRSCNSKKHNKHIKYQYVKAD